MADQQTAENLVPTIRMFDYLSLISDAYMSLLIASDAIGQNREVVYQILGRGIPDILGNDKIFLQGVTAEQKEEMRQQMRQILESTTTEKVDRYVQTVENLTAVSLCSALEICINGVLETIFTHRPQALISFAKDQNITLKQLIEDQSYDASIKRIRERALHNFSREDIGKKFGLLGNLNLKQDQIFNWESYTDTIQEQLQGLNLNFLVSVFDKRNKIIHHGERPFTSAEELALINLLFEKLVMNLCLVASLKFQIPIEFLGARMPATAK